MQMAINETNNSCEWKIKSIHISHRARENGRKNAEMPTLRPVHENSGTFISLHKFKK